MWNAKQRRGRCTEHSLHCGTRAFIKAISPTPESVIKKQMKATLADALDDVVDMERDEWLESSDAEELQSEVEAEFDAKDVLGKVLAFVHQVRSSPQARKYFRKMCEEENIKPLQLLTWVRTRWASLHTALHRILKLRPALTKFVLLADTSNKVPKLRNGKTYEMFKMSASEWETLELVRDVLEVPANACQSFSFASRPSLYRTIPILEYVQTQWETMAEDEGFASMKGPILKGLDNFNKWYRHTDDSDAYFITLGKYTNFLTYIMGSDCFAI